MKYCKAVVILTFFLFVYAGAVSVSYAEDETVKSILDEIRTYKTQSSMYQTHSLLAAHTDSSSYIGTLPNFSIGIGASGVAESELLDSILNNTLTLKGFSNISDVSLGIVPGIVRLRIGGIFLPFDLGISGFNYGLVGQLFSSEFFLPLSSYQEAQGNYVAVELRIPVLQQNRARPGISLGITTTSDNSIVRSTVSRQDVNFVDKNSGQAAQINFSNGNIGLSHSLITLALKGQINKTFEYFDPFFGFEGYYSFGTSNFLYQGKVKASVGGVDSPIKDVVSGIDLDGATLTSTSFTDVSTHSNYSLRIYGGSAIKLGIFFLEFGGSYEFLHSSVALSMGLRIQTAFNNYY